MGISTNTQVTTDIKNTIRILVVEDEYILALNLQESLESLGYTVPDIVDSAEAAIEKATELSPNLILMDIRLRGEIDGIQAAEHIWNRLQIPIIYVTGHSDKSTVERATLTSPFGYILKPIKEQELYVAIQTALNRYEREHFLSTVLREMADGVVVVDAHLRVKYLNQVAEKLTGWRWDEAKERILTEVIKLIDEQTQMPVKNPIISALQQQTTIHTCNRFLLINKDGTSIPIADSATPLKNNNGAIIGAVMVFQDDTQRRLAQERNLAAERARQLEIQMAELQRLNQLKEDFLATTSHEMRTPLSNIKMAIYTLEDILKQQGILNVDTQSPMSLVNHYLNMLRYECERELDLVDDLLSMRMMDADVYPLELTSIQLQYWLSHTAESFEQRFASQHQILQISVDSDLPPLVSDLSLMTRIVSELFNNACKYTPGEERITVTAEMIDSQTNLMNGDVICDISPQIQFPFFQIIFTNSGVQIPIEEQSRIFEPFYRIPNNDPWRHGGTGLGLALVKKLVEYLQGAIAVTSGDNCTRFIIHLPLSFSEPE